MSISLYRKYRSKSLDEIVGQKGVVKALKTAISKESLSHAYLFTGPRGVGKTSIARILALAINKAPYKSDELPVDIIEIDAASNRGIEEIRDLREKAKIAPVSAKYKVYIIDEVHMLTTPAFNALLKTLEEPPAHVIFILATTEGHKLPDTIISRTQRYNFSLATQEEVSNHLSKIATKESIKIDAEAINLIALHSGGSLRDALSTLDHVRHLSNDITAEDVRTNIGLPSKDIIKNILNHLKDNQASDLLNELRQAEQDNVSSAALANELIENLKKNIQDNRLELSLTKTTALIKSLSEVESSKKPNVLLTIALLSVFEENPVNAQPVRKKPENVLKNTQTIKNNSDKITTNFEIDNSKKITPEPHNKPNLQSFTTNKAFTSEAWQELLEDIRSTHNTLYSVLRMAKISLSEIADNKIVLNFDFPFHQKRVSEKRNKTIVSQKLKEHGYGDLKIECGVSGSAKEEIVNNIQAIESVKDYNEDLNQIIGIFEGAEPME